MFKKGGIIIAVAAIRSICGSEKVVGMFRCWSLFHRILQKLQAYKLLVGLQLQSNITLIVTFELQMNLKDIVQVIYSWSKMPESPSTPVWWSCRFWKTKNPCQCAHSKMVVMVADMHKMYNSIHINSVEQHCHKFLWRSLNSTREPEVYAITGVNMGDKPTWAIGAEAI